MRMMNKTVLALALAALAGSVWADGTPAAPAVPTLSDVLTASNIAVTGYVDTGYTNLNTTGLYTNFGATRIFDAPSTTTSHDYSGFALNQAAMTISMTPKEGFGGLVNLTAGQDAKTIGSYGANSGSFDLTQAYGSYLSGPLTLIAGKFATLAGAEVIASPSDTNYSRSILFGAIPFTHTGARATYVASDLATLILGVNNGWDQVSPLTNGKTVEAGVILTPAKTFTLAGTYYGGKETVYQIPDSSAGNRNLFDLVATFNATPALTFVLNYDYVSQDNYTSLLTGNLITATYDGVAGYINYAISDTWRVSLRGEYLDDKDGYHTGYIQKL